jgi:hypothetical protein
VGDLIHSFFIPNSTISTMSFLRPARYILRAQNGGRRGISNIPEPQAYLRPLDSHGGEEFEGVMCLVMDRKEAKNALSVQMVGVSPDEDRVGEERRKRGANGRK